METVANAFNLFINTDRNIPNGSRGDDVTIPLNQSPIVAGDDEHIRLTLDQFWMRKSWYDVNQNNNKFLLMNTELPGAPTKTVELTPGDYSARPGTEFTYDLAEAIAVTLTTLYETQQAFEVVTSSNATAFNETTEMYSIEITVPNEAQIEQPPVVQCLTSLGDAYKVIGGKRLVNGLTDYNEETNTSTNSLNVTWNDIDRKIVIKPFYKVDLTPETHVYLAIDNQPSNNIATNSFTAENTQSVSANFEGMTATRIMASIPIDTYHASYTAKTDRLFFIDLASRVASSLKMVIVDSCGRRIPYVNDDIDQGVYGDRSFKCVIRVDILKGNKTGTLQTMPTPKSVPPRFSSTPAPVLNLGIPGYGLNVPGQVYGDGYDPLAR